MSRLAFWLVVCLFVASAGLLSVFLLRPAARVALFDGHGRLVSYPGKVTTPCPQQDPRTAVIFVAGQSNVANYGERRQATAFRDRVFAFFDGACTIAGSPLLGADSHEGESLTPMADELIRSGRFDRVVLAPVAVGGSRAISPRCCARLWTRCRAATRLPTPSGIRVRTTP